jgi:hypothetical protein
MSEQPERGAAEERAGVPHTPAEDEGPASPASLPGGDDAQARGDAEERAGAPRTESRTS